MFANVIETRLVQGRCPQPRTQRVAKREGIAERNPSSYLSCECRTEVAVILVPYGPVVRSASETSAPSSAYPLML